MNKLTLFVFTALLFACAVSGIKTGAKISMSQNALNNIKNQLLPLALKAAKGANIPDMGQKVKAPVLGKVNFNLKNIRIDTLSVKKSSILFSGKNQLVLSLSDVAIDVRFGWKYRQSSFPHVHHSGKGSCRTSNAAANMIVAIGVDAKGRPTAQIVQGNVNVGSLTIKVSGTASWIYNTILKAFRGKIVSAIQKALNTSLVAQLQNIVNKLLASVPTQRNLGPHLSIDYSMGFLGISNNRLVAGSNGEFFPKGSQPGKAPGQPVAMPDSIANKMIQFFISSFSANSLGYSIYNSALGSKTISADGVPAAAKNFFKTGFYAQYAPGIIKKFGANSDVQLTLGLKQAPNVIFKQGKKIEIKAGLMLTVRVKDPSSKQYKDAFTALVDSSLHGSLKVTDTVITGHLDDATAGKASLVQTQVGSVQVDGISDLFQFGLSIGQDYINNDVLSKGAPLPTMPGMKLYNPSVVYMDNYIAVVSDMSFTPPKALLD